MCPADSARMAVARAFDLAPPEWEVTFEPASAAFEADAVVAVGLELDGAVPFDPAEPARVIEDLHRHLARRRTATIVVCGSSGGCGATTLALHLAAARRGSCVVDAARHGGVAFRLGLDPASLEAEAPVPVAGGFGVVRLGERNPRALLDDLAQSFERVVVDTDRARLGDVIGDCDAGVLVIAPTVPSARAAAELLETYPDVRWALVANRTGPGGETTRAELQRLVARRLTIELPCSRAVRDAEGDGRVVSSAWSPWLRGVRRLSRALETT